MPPLEEADLTDVAVLWEKSGTDRKGQPVLLYPRQVRVRWVQRKSQTLDAQSNVQGTDVDFAAGCNIPLGSILWLGSMNTIPGTADPPTPTSGLMEVVGANWAKDLKGQVCRTEGKARRWSGTLPTVLEA